MAAKRSARQWRAERLALDRGWFPSRRGEHGGEIPTLRRRRRPGLPPAPPSPAGRRPRLLVSGGRRLSVLFRSPPTGPLASPTTRGIISSEAPASAFRRRRDGAELGVVLSSTGASAG